MSAVNIARTDECLRAAQRSSPRPPCHNVSSGSVILLAMSRGQVGIVICLVLIAVVILLTVAVHLFGLQPTPPVVDDYHALLVSRVNARNATWIASVNPFAVRADEQHRYSVPNTDHLQSIFPRILEIDNYAKNVLLSVDIARHLMRLAFVQSVPEHFDARKRWPQCWSIGYVPDQGECGSCWVRGIRRTLRAA